MIRRRGIGKTRHIDTNFLWAQEKGASKEIDDGKILGKDNPADLFTTYLSENEFDKRMATIHFEFKSGTDDVALTINQVESVAAPPAEAAAPRQVAGGMGCVNKALSPRPCVECGGVAAR